MSADSFLRELEAVRLAHHGIKPQPPDNHERLKWGKWRCPTCGDWVKEEMARRCSDCRRAA